MSLYRVQLPIPQGPPAMAMRSVEDDAGLLLRRRRDTGALLALAVAGLIVVACVLVAVHPLEERASLTSEDVGGGKLFESALKSQRAELAKHKATEQIMRAQVASRMAHEDGMSGSSKPMTDTKLFKMAFSSEQRDLKKRDAQIAALKAKAARHAADAVDGLPHSQNAQLSDAKLFADALREQHEDRAKDKASLKVDVKAELRKQSATAMETKKAAKAQMKADLELVEKADGDDSGRGQGVRTAKKVLTTVQKVLSTDKHARHKAAVAHKKTTHRSSAHSTAHAVQKQHVKLPTDSKLYKDALKREGKVPVFVQAATSKSAASQSALAKAHSAVRKKAAARKSQDETVAQEKKLVALLDSDGGSTVKPLRTPKHVLTAKKAEQMAKAQAREEAIEAKQKMHTVVKLAAKYRTGHKGGGKQRQHAGGWAKTAVEDADHSLGHGGKDEFRRTEFARADSIEASLADASLVGPKAAVDSAHVPSASKALVHRGRAVRA